MSEEAEQSAPRYEYRPRVEAEIRIRLPDGTELRRCIAIDEYFRDAFQPLPRDREIPFAITSQERASWQEQQRRNLTAEIAHRFAQDVQAQLLKMIESRDTVNGYSPEEWAAMHPESRQAQQQ